MGKIYKMAAIALWLLLLSACTTDQDLGRVVETRIQAIQAKNLDAFLKVDYYYVEEIEKIEETKPKVIWKKETERLKQKYKTRYEEAINQVPILSGAIHTFNPDGIFLYKNMSWKILEVLRPSNAKTNDGKILSSARVFVECDFKDKNQCPYERYTYDPYTSPKYSPQGKPLKKTILAFNVVTVLTKPTIVDNTEVVEGREYWEAGPR